MKSEEITSRIKVYQITAIITILLTLIGFTYNVYRMGQNEINNTTRVSSFEILKELSNLEQVVFSAYYDKDKIKGNPRIGWVKVGLIKDLSLVIYDKEPESIKQLHQTWQNNWSLIETNNQSATKVINAIEKVRIDIRKTLKNIQ